MIQITALMDDTLTGRKDLLSEHGLSLFVLYHGKRILFDCGSSEKTLYNARKLGIDLRQLDAVVLSHGHYDHAGGFRALAEDGPVGRVYTGPGFFEPKYSRQEACCTSICAGFDRAFLVQKGIVHTTVAGSLKILPGVWVVGSFPRLEPMETIPERFVRQTPAGLAADDFRDEICLALETAAGLVLLVGCAHPGIVNMARHVSGLLGKPIHAVFGGIHLAQADMTRIRQTVQALSRMGVATLGLSHCSGERAEAFVREWEGVRGCHLGPGDCVFFD